MTELGIPLVVLLAERFIQVCDYMSEVAENIVYIYIPYDVYIDSL